MKRGIIDIEAGIRRGCAKNFHFDTTSIRFGGRSLFYNNLRCLVAFAEDVYTRNKMIN